MTRRNLRIVLAAVLVCAVAVAAVFAIGLHNARADPVVRRATVRLPDWPAGAPPMTVALLSDIHIGSPAMDAGRLARIADQVGAVRPDLILIAGDFITGHDPNAAARFAPALVAPLSRLRAPLGTVAVLGNHDHWTGAGQVQDALRRAGVTVLENQAVRKGAIALGVVGDSFTRHDRIAPTVAAMRRLGGAPVVLSHGPDIAGALPADMPLLLARHTHCGQGVAFGRALGAQPYDPRYRCGLIRQGRRLTVVTGGLGTSVVPLRIGAPPDIWLLTLHG